MKVIHSKDIYNICRDIMRCLDPKVMNHGQRTAYLLCRMLQCENKYEMYEIAEFGMLATIHDVGAYRTEDLSDQLNYETKNTKPHSIFGYLYVLYLMPFRDRAKVILNHHTDYNQITDKDYEYKAITDYLNLAEKVDIYSNILGDKFDLTMFEKQAGTKVSPVALRLIYEAEKKYNVVSKLKSGEYKQELNEINEYFIFTNEEKHDILFGLISCIAFRSDYTLVDTVACMQIANLIAEKLLLSEHEKEVLYYAAMIHDAGMCSISKEILEAPRKLTDEEMKKLREHVSTIETIIKGRVDDEVLEVVAAHHERLDGSGYPKRLKDSQMTRLQKIMQVADTMTALTSKRSYRETKPKDTVIAILKEEGDRGRLSREVIRVVIANYDEIMEKVKTRSDNMLAMYHKLLDSYEKTSRAFK